MEPQADEFVTQAREHLTVLEQVLLTLEKPEAGTDVRERVDRCLRIVHSIKGDAGFLGYTAIRTLANAFETVLEDMRDEDSPAPASAVERLLAARDRLATPRGRPGKQQPGRPRGTPLPTGAGRQFDAGTPPGRWDIDLREVDRLRSGRLAEFFASFARLGRDRARRSTWRRRPRPWTPRGPVRFRARLVSASPRDEIRRSLGLPAAHVDGRAGATCRCTSTWPTGCVPADGLWDRSSPRSPAWGVSRTPPRTRPGRPGRGAGHRSRSLATGGCGPDLPGGDVERRLGLPKRDRPPRLRRRPDPPAKPTGPRSGRRPRRRSSGRRDGSRGATNRTGRPRCGSTSSCSTG